jgi:hypothetical protein
MTAPDSAIKELAAALEGLLRAEDTAGERLIYSEHREPIRNEVVMEMCRVCGEVDGHKSKPGVFSTDTTECAVEVAELALRRYQETKS